MMTFREMLILVFAIYLALITILIGWLSLL